MENKFKITEGDLVGVKVPVKEGKTIIWHRVMFVDLDGSMIIRADKYPSFFDKEYPEHMEDRKILDNQVSLIIRKEDADRAQFCYSDGVTVCDCPGTCRNK